MERRKEEKEARRNHQHQLTTRAENSDRKSIPRQIRGMPPSSKSITLLIISVVVVTKICLFISGSDPPRKTSEKVVQLQNHYLEPAPSSSKCLTAALYAVNHGGGTGNVMFELLAREEDSRIPYLYVMSDDSLWAQNTFHTYERTSIAANNSTPPCTEWEFSKMFCDRVLLTASMSTYGYWIGYLSRGQKVYYNYAFTNEFEKQLGPTDFWPPHWIAIQYQHREKKIREWFPHDPDVIRNSNI
ncbi:hypothetical protein RB195_007853 [Necator americanus]|uniref:Core-2/I-Branching enzyme n=1 Tax=Necator americanus TaxID=51031 RepID=A0ABR1BZ80_NECAM